MPDAPALLAGRYRLGTLLGRGGMGEVRLARDEVLERDVAVKEIDQPAAADEDAAARRTLREARAAARLSHPGVVQVYDVLQLDGRTWIVMEYVPSRSLRQVIEQDGVLDPYRAARIGLDLLAALRAAHRVGVQHRDVKPANVLLADDGRVLLSDFGIAAVDDDAVISLSNVVVGSPQFMAPERASTGSGGPEADLWSLGATLYAAVEGRPPYQRPSTMATLAALTTEEPDPPQRAGALRPLLDGLLRKDPAARMGAEDAEALLRRIIADLTEDSGRPLWQIPRQRGTAAAVTAAREPAGDPDGRAVADDDGPGGQTAVEGVAVPAPGDDVAAADSPAASAADAGGDGVAASAPGDDVAGADSPAASAADASGDGVAVAGAGARAGAGVSAAGRGAGSEGGSDAREAGPVPGNGKQGVRRRAVLAGVGVLTALVAGGAVWLVAAQDEKEPAAQRPGATRSAGPQNVAPPATATPGTEPPGSRQPGAGPEQTPEGTRTAPSGGAAGARPELPAGWRDYRDATGFQVYVPSGWKRSKEGSIVYFRGDGRVLGIDQTDEPKSDPVKDWQNQSRYRRSQGDFPGYREIRLEAVTYFRKAADWEFTFDRSGVRQHVNNRGVVVASDKAYGFYWQTRDAEWDAAREDLQLVFDSFRPAA